MPVTEAQAMLALPPHGFVRHYVNATTQLTDAPLAFQLTGALTTLSVAVDLGLGMYGAGGTMLYPPIWGLLVGESFEARKTTVIEHIVAVLTRYDKRLLGDQPRSTEGLVTGLQQQPQQLLTYPEFGEFLQKTSDPRGYAASLRTAFTSIYDCLDFSHRSVKKVYRVSNPRLSLAGGVTPEYIEDWTDTTDWHGGFMSRWGIIWAERERTMPATGTGVDVEALLGTVVTQLQEIGSLRAQRCGGYTRSAARILNDWHADLRRQYPDAPPWAVGALGRAERLARKVAMLLAFDIGLASERDGWRVEQREMELAVYFAAMHVQSVVELTANLASTPFERSRRSILRTFAKGPRTLGQILDEARPRPQKDRAIRVLETLQEAGTVFTFRGPSNDVFYTTDSTFVTAYAGAPTAQGLQPVAPQAGQEEPGDGS